MAITARHPFRSSPARILFRPMFRWQRSTRNRAPRFRAGTARNRGTSSSRREDLWAATSSRAGSPMMIHIAIFAFSFLTGTALSALPSDRDGNTGSSTIRRRGISVLRSTNSIVALMRPGTGRYDGQARANRFPETGYIEARKPASGLSARRSSTRWMKRCSKAFLPPTRQHLRAQQLASTKGRCGRK